MTTQTINLVKTQLKPLTIGIVAGEVSGDALGADFMRQMNNLRDDITWVGVGGSQMQALGLKSIIHMSRLSVMGLVHLRWGGEHFDIAFTETTTLSHDASENRLQAQVRWS